MNKVYILQHKTSLLILGCCATRDLADLMLEGGIDKNVQIVECDIVHK